MNDLQLALIGVGAVAVVGVVIYNKWQERRHRHLAEAVLQRGHDDVLMGGQIAVDEGEHSVPDPESVDLPAYQRRREATRATVPIDGAVPFDAPPETLAEAPVESFPVLRDEPLSRREPMLEPRSEPVLAERVEPSLFAEPPVVEMAPEMPPTTTESFSVSAQVTQAAPSFHADVPMQDVDEAITDVPPILVSPAIDYVAAFELVEAIPGDRILNSQRELMERITKPVNWAGYNDKTREWERMVEYGDYRRFRVGLQLADRRGPLGEADLLTFYGAMQELAEELMAVSDLPPRQEALDAAIALDHFCANVDIQIGINLVSQGNTFPGTKIRALAEAAGMMLEPGGRFVRRNDDGDILYTLGNLETTEFTVDGMKTLSTHSLVFLLDVPCVSHGDRVFAQMLDVARRMADTLKGMLVDDNRRPLTESMLDPFRRQIGQYQTQLAAKGLPAGSPLTLRLFV